MCVRTIPDNEQWEAGVKDERSSRTIRQQKRDLSGTERAQEDSAITHMVNVLKPQDASVARESLSRIRLCSELD